MFSIKLLLDYSENKRRIKPNICRCLFYRERVWSSVRDKLPCVCKLSTCNRVMLNKQGRLKVSSKQKQSDYSPWRYTRMLPAFCRNNLVLFRQIPHEEAPAKKLRLSKPSKSAALHIDLCKATNSTDALQYLLQFARKPVEVESVEGVVRILLEHYYKVKRKYGS